MDLIILFQEKTLYDSRALLCFQTNDKRIALTLEKFSHKHGHAVDCRKYINNSVPRFNIAYKLKQCSLESILFRIQMKTTLTILIATLVRFSLESNKLPQYILSYDTLFVMNGNIPVVLNCMLLRKSWAWEIRETVQGCNQKSPMLYWEASKGNFN